jgi:hypothetical protein
MSSPKFRSDIDNIIKEVLEGKASEVRLRAHRARAEMTRKRRKQLEESIPKPSEPIRKEPYIVSLEKVAGVLIATISDRSEIAVTVTNRFSNETDRYCLFLSPIELSNRLGWFVTKQSLKELLGEDI